MNEQTIQNEIRLHASSNRLAVLFRANVGEGWTGNLEDITRNPDGSITIRNPRRLKTGLPKGFSDLFGVTSGGRAVFIEVKSRTGRVSAEQEHFLEQMASMGALAGVARSVEEAERIIRGTRSKCWRKTGCMFNSNTSQRYKKCLQDGYSVEQCRVDNEGVGR